MRQRREERVAQRENTTTIVRIIVHKPGIDKGIAIPRPRAKARNYEYPWEDMAVGDSFKVPCEVSSMSSVSTRVGNWNRRHPGTRFITRQMIDDEGKKYTRVWREE